MTWENIDCTWMSDFECWLYTNPVSEWLTDLNHTLWRVWDNVWFKVQDSFWSIWDSFMTTTPWKIVWFIWDLLWFLLYGVRSIILLIWNLIYSVLNWFVQMFSQLLSTFTDLSVFMWSTTSMLVSMFTLVIMLIWFQFLLRFFTWKFHYKKVWK